MYVMERKKGKETAQHSVWDQMFPLQMGRCKASGFLVEINLHPLLLKYKVTPAQAQKSMGSRDGKCGSHAYELPAASRVFFI